MPDITQDERELYQRLERELGRKPGRRTLQRHGLSERRSRVVARELAAEVRLEIDGSATRPETRVSFDEVPELGEYRFELPGRVDPLIISEDQLQQLARDYDGATMTRLAHAHGLARRELHAIKTVLGWTKDAVRLTPAQVRAALDDEEEEERLTRDRTALLLGRVERKSRRDSWRELERRAKLWSDQQRKLVDPLERVIARILDDPPKQPPIDAGQQPASGHGHALVVNPTDLHYGLRAGVQGWTYGPHAYDQHEARRRLLRTFEELKQLAPDDITKVVLVVGGDWLHIDTPSGTTTKGTAQDTDALPEDIAEQGIRLAIEAVQVWSSLAPVEVVIAPGNHDRWTLGASLGLVLDAWFRTSDRVKVTRAGPVHYLPVWSTLLGVTHGDGISKAADLAHRMAADVPDLWGSSAYRVWITGHLHHLQAVDMPGVRIWRLPSLAGSSRWEHGRYAERLPELAALLIHPTRGPVATLHAGWY